MTRFMDTPAIMATLVSLSLSFLHLIDKHYDNHIQNEFTLQCNNNECHYISDALAWRRIFSHLMHTASRAVAPN